MRLSRVRVRRFWMCSRCGRSFFLVGKVRDHTAPECVHTGTRLEGTEPHRMTRLGVGAAP